MDSNKLPVKLAQVHQPIDLAGFITKKTLSDAYMQGLKMFWTDNGLLLEYRKQRSIIPSANIAIVVLDDSEAKPASQVKNSVKA